MVRYLTPSKASIRSSLENVFLRSIFTPQLKPLSNETRTTKAERIAPGKFGQEKAVDYY